MGRQELIQEYPPKDWVCPECGHKHNKPHYSLSGQIDYSVEPDKKGRILFNRRDKDDQLATDTPIDHSKPMKGKQFDEDGFQRALFCPHCGYEDDWTVVIRMGDLPDLVDRFFEEEDVDPKKTWRKLLNQFLGWIRKRETGQ